MTITSMTGFARATGSAGDWTWTWEVKSVNGRNLDLRTRLSAGLEALEPGVREAAATRLRRGHVSIALQASRSISRQRIKINEEVLAQLRDVSLELQREYHFQAPTADGLLGLRGVVELIESEESEAAAAARDAAMLASLEQALDGLNVARREEGKRLAQVIDAQLDDIGRLAGAAGACAEAQPEAIKARLAANLETVLAAATGVSEERLVQELALLIVKADVREELDRLASHVTAARELMASAEPAGRKLDFLAQEFNREANTLCAKAADVALTRIGLDLKATIDQFREQVQNIE